MNTVEMWIAAENFYTFTIPIVIVLLLIWAIVVVFIVIYTEKKSKTRKYFFVGSGLLIISFGIYSWFSHERYSEYLSQHEFINPGLRSYSVFFGFVNHEDPALIDLYQQDLIQAEQFRSLDMYNEQIHQEPFAYEYIGVLNRDHYFMVRDDEDWVFRFTGNIEPTEEESYVQGYYFELVDEEFQNYGFMEPTYPLVETIFVNDEEYSQSQGADITLPNTIIHISFILEEWTLGYQRTSGTNLEQ